MFPVRPTLVALSVIQLLAMPVASAAQLAGAGTGSVVGRVTDEAGLPVSGVEVTISGPNLAPPRKVSTRENGEYRIAWLSPGDYSVTFTSPGFESELRHAPVSLAFTLTLDVELKVAARRENLVVRGALDRYSATLSQTFSTRELAAIPSSRGLSGLFAVTPAVNLGNTEVGGGTGLLSGFSGAYGRTTTSRHTVEGIVVIGLFGAGFSPDYGALEQVSLQTGASGAEWPTAGIHTDITTKSGSNQYRGSLYAAGEHRRVQSSNVDADQVLRGAVHGDGLQPGQVNQLWRNTDVNADIGGFIHKDRAWWYTSARHQVVESRLVNFRAAPYRTELTNISGKLTARLSPGHKVVVYGQRGRNHQPYRLDPFGPPGSGLTAGTVRNETTDSTINQRNTAWIWKLEWNGVLSDSLMFESRVGQWANNSRSTPWTTAPRFEDVDTSVVWGGNVDQQSSARRNQFFVTGSYFTENRSGRHYMRIGGEAIRFLVQDELLSGFPGNVVHVLRSGRPTSVYLFNTPSLAEGGVWSLSGYVSDAWQISRRLTATLGVRFDRHRLFLPAQSSPATIRDPRSYPANPNLAAWNQFAPRLSAVFDVEGNGRTLVKLAYGRYRWLPNAGAAFNANPNTGPWWTQYTWSDPNGSGRWEPGEEGVDGQRTSGGEIIEETDPDMRLPVVDEISGWIERALPAGITLRFGAVYRLETFQIARHNLHQRYEDFNVPVSILDRGPDGLEGTGDDGRTFTAYDLDPDYVGQPPRYQLRNVAGSSSEYLTWEIAAGRRLGDRWGFGASFAYTENGDHASSYLGQPVRNNTYPLTPNDLINAGPGGRHEFTTWTARAYGSVQVPWTIRLTPVLRHQSGQPFGRTQRTDRGELAFGNITMLMEPIGTRRMDHITLLDLRFERSTPVKGGRVSVFLDVFNCLNANPEQNAVWSPVPAFLKPLAIVPPRIARAGVTFDW